MFLESTVEYNESVSKCNVFHFLQTGCLIGTKEKLNKSFQVKWFVQSIRKTIAENGTRYTNDRYVYKRIAVTVKAVLRMLSVRARGSASVIRSDT